MVQLPDSTPEDFYDPPPPKKVNEKKKEKKKKRFPLIKAKDKMMLLSYLAEEVLKVFRRTL